MKASEALAKSTEALKSGTGMQRQIALVERMMDFQFGNILRTIEGACVEGKTKCDIEAGLDSQFSPYKLVFKERLEKLGYYLAETPSENKVTIGWADTSAQ